MDRGPNLVWTGCCMLAMKDGVVPIASAPDGIYRRKVGEWQITINGTEKDKPETDSHPKLPRFAVYVEFNGWPAGIIDPAGGLLAAGAAANEDTLIAAIEADLGCSIDDYMSRKDN
jgi:hypothetical protein